MLNKVIKAETTFGGSKLKLETGRMAKRADAAVLASLGDTTVLVTVVSTPSEEDRGFFPLRVDYEEKFYAGGLIGGSRFTRREGRPTDDATVSARLMDHTIRPLFPKNFMDNTQIITTVLSIDGKNSPVLLGLFAASAALSISGLPFKGPLVSMRVQRLDGKYDAGLFMHSKDSDMDIIASYLDNGRKVQAIEAEANIVPDNDMLEGINFGAEKSGPLFEFLQEFVGKHEVKPKRYKKAWLNSEVVEPFKQEIHPVMNKLYDDGISPSSDEWVDEISKLVEELHAKHKEEYTEPQIRSIVSEVKKEFLRTLVLEKGQREDNRKFDEVRPLSAEAAVLPRVHGSGLFSRGQTQALSVATLASGSQEQLIQNMSGEREKRYMHHYNFPPYSVGEVWALRGAGRREIGHGLLAEKALLPVLPAEDKFVYAMRVVSEILSSNGSTSMAAVCASSLALMDAGVPIKEHVGGIGVGLYVDVSKEASSIEDYKLLTDIVGDEDASGYMDYKMAGTRNGVTAIQMELKLLGIPIELLQGIFEASKSARMQVLDVMESAIKEPRKNLSKYAPKIEVIKVEKDVIGQIIGSGGAVIKKIMSDFDCEIDIDEKDDHALVSIAAMDSGNLQKAKEYIVSLVTPIEIGAMYTGKVVRVENYGAFVEIAPKKDGLLHVSELSDGFVNDINEVVKVGDTLEVFVKSVENGKIALSKKSGGGSNNRSGRPQQRARRKPYQRRPQPYHR